VATVIPISNPNLSHDKGIFIGRNIYTNAPIYVDTFCGPPTLPNPHIFICGTSGGGKSVALKTLTARNIITTRLWCFFYRCRGRIYKLNKNVRSVK